jgi:hypothetical protein
MSDKIVLAFAPGELVTLRTDGDKRLRIVTRVTLDENGMEYGLRCGDHDTTWHKCSEIVGYTEEKARQPGFVQPKTRKRRK